MRNILLFFSVLLFSVSAWAQELTLQGRVVDDKTGEALPYVSFYIGEGKGTLSNADGEFKLKVDEGGTVVISCVGYDKQTIAANAMPETIRLKPYTTALREVTVQAMDNNKKILKRIIKNLKQDYKSQGQMTHKYFFRTLTEKENGTFIAEAFMTAYSVVNIRSARIISGLQGSSADDHDEKLNFKFSNSNKLIEVGPNTFKSTFWSGDIKPLSSYYTLRHYYDVSMQYIHGEDGKGLYKIVFSWKKRLSPEDSHKRNITGTAYVDAETCRLLRFDGSCNNHHVSYATLSNLPTTINFHLEYDYSQGVASVSHLAIHGDTQVSSYRTLAFAIEKEDGKPEESYKKASDIVSAVKSAGFDPKLWEEYDIVKRTKEEEQIAFGEMNDDSNKRRVRKAKFPEAFSPLMRRLNAFGKALPQEKVYVHMDNTCYFQGDTIWFTAYLMETDTGKPSEISELLYVELLNNDGYLVERKLIEMKEGRGNGFFALNKMIQYSGFYELRAYTRWQLNWGVHEHNHAKSDGLMFRDKESEKEFFRDYDKLYSRVFPVYDKPAVPGSYARNMTLRVMRRTFKTDMDEKERKPLLSLFPEGGNLVAGVQNRVAFEAAMTDGEQLEGTLTVGNDTVNTVNRGRGTFMLIPDKETEREVTFTSTTGRKVTAKLPKPEEEGVAVQVTQEGDSTIITTNVVGLAPDSLALTIMHEGMLEDYHVLGDSLIKKTGGLMAGIHQVTVFDTQGRVWADRLFFVKMQDVAEPTLTVEGMQYKYPPHQKIELKVKAPTRSTMEDKPTCISLAIRDGNQTDALFDNGNIMTEMLLSSEIKGFIPNPGWYFQKDDEEHRQALDLLMMTQGWRRFIWRDMAKSGTWDLTQPDEKIPVIKGRVAINPNRISLPAGVDSTEGRNAIVNRIDTKAMVALAEKTKKPRLLIHAELADIDSNETISGDYNVIDNSFKLLCPKYFDYSVLFLSVADENIVNKGRKKYPWIQLAGYMEDLPQKIRKKLVLGEADYRAYISWPYPRFVKPYGYYQSHMPQTDSADENDIPTELLAESARNLREVPVTAKRRNRLKRFNDAYPAFSVDAYEAWNYIEDAGVPIYNYVNISRQIVRVYLNDYGLPEPSDEDSRIILQFGLSPTRRSLPQYIDIPTDSLYHPKYLTSMGQGFTFSPGERREYFGDETINEDPRFLLDRFVVYTDYQPRHEGSDRYLGSNRPETRVAVYPIYDWNKRPIYRDRRYLLPGFSSPAQFYSPDYSKQMPPEPTDYRRTLYWNPDLKLDENGEARITFYNNSRNTRLSIEAEGQATDGTLLWNKMQ